MKPSDALLFRQIRDGNEKAFETLFRHYYSPLCAFARKFIPDKDEAEEIVQNFFVSFWEKRDAADQIHSPKSYLFSSVRNHCLNHLKHHKIRAEHEEYVKFHSADGENVVEEYLAGKELRGRINEGIEALPDRCREVFHLSRHEGLKYSEIAQKMGISVKTVEVQMGKALKLLRESVRDLLPFFILIIIFLEKISDWIRVL